MATFSDTNADIVALLSGSAIVYFTYHTYKFDKWRCLLPHKKDWFRLLLTWILLASMVGLFAFATIWCVVKYRLGWIYVPDMGAIPYPPTLFEQKYIDLNRPATAIFGLAFSMQTTLNAEEGMYWYHLMRAVRQPKSAKSWLSSGFFYSWIVISIITTLIQCTMPWIKGGQKDMVVQIARVMTVDGFVELGVLAMASIVLLKFPAFLKDVKASGASPDVRSRLHFYHEVNKVRSLFRFLFSASMIVLGIDGLTEKMVVNNSPLASDLLSQLAFGSYFVIIVTSTMLYLPRNWVPENERRANVLVGDQYQPPLARSQAASGLALMSLLREGGQWHADTDEDLRSTKGVNLNDSTWGQDAKEADWESEASQLDLPVALENFISPIAVQTTEGPVPNELRIHVAHEVHRAGNDYV